MKLIGDSKELYQLELSLGRVKYLRVAIYSTRIIVFKIVDYLAVIVDGMDTAALAKRRRLLKLEAGHVFHSIWDGGAICIIAPCSLTSLRTSRKISFF